MELSVRNRSVWQGILGSGCRGGFACVLLVSRVGLLRS